MSTKSDEPMVEVRIRCGRGDVMPFAALLMTGGIVVAKQRDEPMMADLGEHLSDELLAGLAAEAGADDHPLLAYLKGVNELAHADPSRGPPPERFDVEVVQGGGGGQIPEHAAVVAVLEAIGELELTRDYHTFKVTPSTTAYYDQQRGEAQVGSMVISQTLESLAPDVSVQKIRAMLDGVMTGKAARPRSPDGRRFRAWRFDALALEQQGILSLESAVGTDD